MTPFHSRTYGRWLRVGVATLSLAALLPSAAFAAPGTQPARIDDDLAQQISTTAQNQPLHVLVEAAGQRGVGGADGNTRRAQDADTAVRRAGGHTSGQIGLVGAAAADLTPAQIQKLAGDSTVAHISLDRPV